MAAPRTPKVQADVEHVTPELAELWLGKNTLNRGLRNRRVAAYARDMATGQWRLTGEAVKFSRKGRLLDGQHRLHAVIAADTAVDMLIVRGLDDGAQEVLDSGAARTAADALHLRGEGDYTALSSAARLAILLEAGQLAGAAIRATHSEILSFVDAHPDLRDAVSAAASWRKAIDIPLSVNALCIWRLSQVDSDDAERFFTELAEKTDLKSGSPVLALDNRLRDIRRSQRRMLTKDWVSLVFRAWNDWRAGNKVTTYTLSRQGMSVAIPDPK